LKNKDKTPTASILIITGYSGAGKTTVMACLKDLGYLTIDNLPFEMFADFLKHVRQDTKKRYSYLALGVDVGDNEFINNFLIQTKELKKIIPYELLFLSCKKNVLIKRYSETRRKHPLSDKLSISEVISMEMELLDPFKAHADKLIDTTHISIHQLKHRINKLYGKKSTGLNLHVDIISFGYKFGIPESANLVFDVRFLQNPYFVPELRNKTGRDEKVYKFVTKLDEFKSFITNLEKILNFLLPLYDQEGKHYLTIAFGCTGGKHRSVSATKYLSSMLKKPKYSYSVSISHRDIDKS